MLRVNGSAASSYASHPRMPLDQILRLAASDIPILSDQLVHHYLSLDVAVLEPLVLRFFPDFLGGLYSSDLADIRQRYRRAPDTELLLVVTGALATDYFWTCRSVFVEDPVIATLRRTIARDLPPPPISWAC